MRILFYYPLNAFSRVIRIILAEKQLEFKLQYEFPWSLSDELLSISRYGILPVLTDINGTVISGVSTIIDYLEEAYPDNNLIGRDLLQRIESRQLANWFLYNFYQDVYYPVMDEKIIKRFKSKTMSAPNPSIIRNALYKIPKYLDYVTQLLDRRSWLAGRDFSIADICAASFISVLDYLGTLKWVNYDEILQVWYLRIKSRRSFASLLTDLISNIPPSKNYSKLDY